MTRVLFPDRPLVLIGLMGVGKTTVGRRLATALGRKFRDADEEIEKAAGRSVSEIFDDFGETAFRDGERKVIARLLENRDAILALGGGAFVDPSTRALVREHALSIWLQADIPTLVKRVRKRDTRPLLRDGDPTKILSALLEKRRAAYSEADLHVDASTGSHQETVTRILDALKAHAAGEAEP
ncbi:shikimate kinase [Maricaulis sp. CAU 1757]